MDAHGCAGARGTAARSLRPSAAGCTQPAMSVCSRVTSKARHLDRLGQVGVSVCIVRTAGVLPSHPQLMLGCFDACGLGFGHALVSADLLSVGAWGFRPVCFNGDEGEHCAAWPARGRIGISSFVRGHAPTLESVLQRRLRSPRLGSTSSSFLGWPTTVAPAKLGNLEISGDGKHGGKRLRTVVGLLMVSCNRRTLHTGMDATRSQSPRHGRQALHSQELPSLPLQVWVLLFSQQRASVPPLIQVLSLWALPSHARAHPQMRASERPCQAQLGQAQQSAHLKPPGPAPLGRGFQGQAARAQDLRLHALPWQGRELLEQAPQALALFRSPGAAVHSPRLRSWQPPPPRPRGCL